MLIKPPVDPYTSNMDADAQNTAVEYLRHARKVAVLTGAGVSAESGVPTFRASDGLWEGHHIEDVATPHGFQRDPKLVWSFYNARRENLRHVSPNPGHYALVALQKKYPSFTLATQNVDGLHTAAGSLDVLELHGNIRRTRCTVCGDLRDRGLEPLGELPICECSGLLRPDIVWFYEMLSPLILDRAMRAAETCDVLLVVGTSAVVYPAAGMIPTARSHGAKVIEVNLSPTDASVAVDVGLYAPSGIVLPQICRGLGVEV